MNISFKNTVIAALVVFYGFSAEPDFIIIPQKKTHVSGSKNSLKEKLGESAKQAINFTTELGSLMGHVKVGFSGDSDKLCGIGQLRQMQKNDGQIQIHLSSIQSSFTNMIELLIDNKGFFKRASRHDLSELVLQINDICGSLRDQVKKFEHLNGLFHASDGVNSSGSLVMTQFNASVQDLKNIHEKVRGLKCLKKS